MTEKELREIIVEQEEIISKLNRRILFEQNQANLRCESIRTGMTRKLKHRVGLELENLMDIAECLGDCDKLHVTLCVNSIEEIIDDVGGVR